MTFEDAIRLSIRKYYSGEDPTELMGTAKGTPRYTRDFFDELEEEFCNDASKGYKKRKAKNDEVETDEYS
tara:strand:- start:6206 stop:6415 length:210 start_codon:yes stop_codon:yes gene_type:complete